LEHPAIGLVVERRGERGVSEDLRSPGELYDGSSEAWVRTEPALVSDFTARPAMLELCQPLAGARVLDIGCGEGYCARMLRHRGAREVVGIDVSGSMVDAARRQEASCPLGIRYERGDATFLPAFADGHFDIVLAVFMLNYLRMAAMTACMQEIRRVLGPSGRFVFVVPHPALPWLRGPEPPLYFDVAGRGYFEARDARLPGRMWKRDGRAVEVQLVHKTVEDYFTSLTAASFRSLSQVLELRVTEQLRRLDPRFFGPLGDTPLHLAFVLDR
jgi:SAM-dependent methyltransferase